MEENKIMKRLIRKIAIKLLQWSNPEDYEPENIQWVVNDNAELGVKVNGWFYWLYKGGSICYITHDDGTPIKYREVGKREFGECCHPTHLNRLPDGPYAEGFGWKECKRQ